MEIRWLPHYQQHCTDHHPEAPEICPALIEQILEHGSPSRVYSDKTYANRHVFEGYFPPGKGRPYRVIFEISGAQEVLPVSCWRIKDRDFRKRR